MGPQNLNNYYFNRLDAKLSFSSYHDFYLVADERGYNREVVYSNDIIGVNGNAICTSTGGNFPSNKLGVYMDLNSTGTTYQPTIFCNDYIPTNTLLSLSYWDEARPNQHDVDCRCLKCETKGFGSKGSFVESICDIGLTGIDNGLTRFMSGNTTDPSSMTIGELSEGGPCDLCLSGFSASTSFGGFITGTTVGSTTKFTVGSWSVGTPGIVNTITNGLTFPNSGGTLNSTSISVNDNFEDYDDCSDFHLDSCCVFMTPTSQPYTEGWVYKVTLSKAEYLSSSSSTFVAKTDVKIGVITAPCKLETIKLWKSMPDKYKYDPLHYDRRFKMHAVTGYTNNEYNYNIVSVSGTSGYYNELYGGFYQGFWKLDGHPYEVLPQRPECGWTTECLLKIRTGSTICTSYNNTLNEKYPNNKGFFWYIGTRAENKFHNVYSGECGLTTCAQLDYSCTGTSVYLTSSASTIVDDHCQTRRSYITGTTYDSGIDVWSNSLGLRLTDDYRVGYRAIYYTGTCMTSGTCITGLTYSSGFTVVEKYSDNVICQLTGTTQSEPWVLITARFRRNYCYDNKCDLSNEGGVNDLLEPVTPNNITYADTSTPDYGVLFPTPIKKEIHFSKKWTDNRWLRTGVLTIFVNGRPVFVDDDFEEIIPRRLNTEPQKQVGVPYNMSWGGGSQGLIDNLTFMSGCTGNSAGPPARTCEPYTQDPTDLNLLIEEYFAGTWDGGISQMRYYLEPLGADEIIHNYLVNKDRYNLIDCSCLSTTCIPGRAIYIRDGDSLDIIIEYNNTDVTYTTDIPPVCINHMNNVAVDRLNLYVDPGYSGVKIKNAVLDNVQSYVIYRHSKSTAYAAELVTFPFTLLATDVVNVYITQRIVCTNPAKVTLMGNLYK